jgi:4-oxalocrotonate tautomerase
MPHVIVKLWPGKSEQQKRRLAEAIAKDVMDVLHYGEGSVSVAIEEVPASSHSLGACPDGLTVRPGTPRRGENWRRVSFGCARVLSHDPKHSTRP